MKKIINNRYHIRKELGKGVMGSVYLTEDKLRPGEDIAVKVINSTIVNSENIDIFKNEFEVMTRLHHPNLVSVYDFGKDHSAGNYYLTMQYINGVSLNKYLPSRGTLSGDRIHTFMITLLRVLDFVHSRNIVHRDIKPENIMITDDSLILMDFSLADFNRAEQRVKGTIMYMAPEVIRGTVDHRTDIFALGMIFYQLLTGVAFYHEYSTQDLLNLLTDEGRFKTHLLKSLSLIKSTEMRLIIQTMLRFDPVKRYRYCSQILSALNKELSQPIPVETPDTRKAYITGATFVGRSNEINYLIEKLTGADNTITYLHGEPGIGKSRLMYEFKNYCQLKEIMVLEGNAFEHISTSYYPLLPILYKCLLYAHEDLIDTFGCELKKILPDSERLRDISCCSHHDPQREKKAIMQAVVNFITGFVVNASHRCVLYINDAQWADDDTIEVISFLQKRTRIDLPIYITSREEGIEKVMDILTADVVDEYKLELFNSDHVTAYITTMFGKDRLGPTLLGQVSQISRKVGGNPFYLQELLKSFVERDIIYKHDYYWEIRDALDNIMIPGSIQELVMSRLERYQLDARCIMVLDILALMDRHITSDELLKIVNVTQDELNRLLEAEVLQSYVRDEKLVYTFAHDLIKTAVDSNITNRQQLHANIAHTLEQIHGSNPGSYIDELAYHYHKANIRDKAVVYLKKAIEKAVELFANKKIMEYGEQLLQLLSGNDTGIITTIQIEMAEACRMMNDKKQFFKYAESVVELSQRINDVASTARIYSVLGRYYIDMRESATSLDYYQKSLAIYETLQDKKNIALCYNYIGGIQQILNDLDKSAEYLNKAFLIAKEAGDIQVQAFSTGNMGFVYFQNGDYEKALIAHKQALELIRPIGDKENEIVGLGSIGEMYLHIERYDQALRYLNECLAAAQSIDADWWYGVFALKKVKTLLGLDRLTEAENLLARVKDVVLHTCDHSEIFYVYMLEIEIFVKKGKIDDALAFLTSLLTEEEEEENIARIYFELWLIRRDSDDKAKALKFYNALYVESGTAQFKEYIDKLKGNGGKLEVADSTILKEETNKLTFFKDLLHIIHDLNSNYTLDDLLEKVLDTSIRLMDAGRGVVLLYNSDGVLTIKKARDNQRQDLDVDDLQLSRTVIQQVIEKEKAMFVADISYSDDLVSTESILDLELQSVMCAPLGRRFDDEFKEKRKYPFLTATQKLGLIYLDNKRVVEETNFIGTNLELFQALADQASIAILNTILYERINIDALTGLYLRPYFEQSLASELLICNESKSHITVLMIDVDFFKQVNDKYGHQIGDTVLKKIASVLKENLRATDICGRYGGEEFIVLLPNTDLDQAVRVVTKLQEKITGANYPAGKITVSIGISSFPLHSDNYILSETAHKLVKYADQALYHAKQTGRDRYVIWRPELVNQEQQTSSIRDILSGNPIRDFKNVQMLLEVIKLLNQDFTIDELLDNILNLILKYIDTDQGLIFLFNKETKLLEIKAARERTGRRDPSASIKFSSNIVESVFKTGVEIYSSAILNEFQSQSVLDLDLHSVMCVPLIVKNENIGIIYIDSKKELNELSINELSFLKAIATQVSLCIMKVY